MGAQTAVAIALALAATTLTNLAYLREHDAVAALPGFSLRMPARALMVLLTNRDWLRGFALESTGFGLYVVALALAPLTRSEERRVGEEGRYRGAPYQ